MVPKKSLILAGAALAMLGASAGAQSQSTKLFKRAGGGSVKQATLDLGTGTYTRGPAVHQRGGFTVADFQNLDAFDGSGFGWVTVDTGGGTCRWFSNAAKGAAANQSTNASDLMSDVVFFYCSNALDVASGGAGGSVTLGFYEGYTVFGGAPTTTAALVALTGMPANTSQGSWFSAGAGCYGLRVIFPTLVAFADNAFMGYSWDFTDTGTDGTLANTYPFMSCVVSCSGMSIFNGSSGGVGGNSLGLGEDGQGMMDVWDQFCVAPTVTHTFTFGTSGAPFSPSTYAPSTMRIQEAGDLAATNVNYNASITPNTDLISANKATLGGTWSVTLSRIPASVAGTYTLNLKRNKHPNANGGPGGSPPFGRVLTAGLPVTTLTGAHNGTSGNIAVAVPAQMAYCGFHFTVQARSTGGGGAAGVRLSSAIDSTIGTF
ncbi:MAG: hypothetical protein HOP15_01970 [Planctomycetes bacterium]|nr:hypothetical protein [Planctomycetota bacterium]